MNTDLKHKNAYPNIYISHVTDIWNLSRLNNKMTISRGSKMES